MDEPILTASDLSAQMLYRDKILAAFNSRRGDFTRFDGEVAAQCGLYRNALDQAGKMTSADIITRLKSFPSAGALPTAEFDQARSTVVPFEPKWENLEEARKWAYATILGRTTFAADGSQIIPTKDYSVPVAAVQVGWFENPHSADGRYTKDVSFELLSPGEIVSGSPAGTGISEQAVHRRRYATEIAALTNYMLAASDRGFPPDGPPVVFFDSLLVISFAETMQPEHRQFYVSEITSLLAMSEKTGIPVVGYVDSSFARDLTVMLANAFSLPARHQISDAILLSPRMKWGDRTPIFGCARSGILESYGEQWHDRIGFVYLKTSGDCPPARLDIPIWVYERGLLDYVIDTVRAEVVAGNGYPYAIETADAAAVLTARDREAFYAMFQEFAEKERLSLRVSRKALSKALRR
ncbi:MAG TPA: DNA double-strand break repair nuclease NurA [Blastocatellia bacterium]